MFGWKFVYFLYDGEQVLNANVFSLLTSERLTAALDLRISGSTEVRHYVITS